MESHLPAEMRRWLTKEQKEKSQQKIREKIAQKALAKKSPEIAKTPRTLAHTQRGKLGTEGGRENM